MHISKMSSTVPLVTPESPAQGSFLHVVSFHSQPPSNYTRVHGRHKEEQRQHSLIKVWPKQASQRVSHDWKPVHPVSLMLCHR